MEKPTSLLVSDYDGTYFDENNPNQIYHSNDSVIDLTSNGHLFMISTGRSFTSINGEIIKYNIPYDYLSCSNGNVLLSKNNIIDLNAIKDSSLEELKEFHSHIESLTGLDISGEKTSKEVVEYILKIKLDEKIRKAIIHILHYSEILDYTTERTDRSIIHIFNRSNKTRDINLASKVLNIPQTRIFTIGDSINDYEMIRLFNGFFIKNDRTNTPQYALKEYENIQGFFNDAKEGLLLTRKK